MKEFKSTYILRILQIIHYQHSVGELLGIGLSYSQIAELISYVLQQGFVVDLEEDGLKLTKEGSVVLEKLTNKLYPSNSNSWILPIDEYRVPKKGKFDIYLPKKKKSWE